MTVSQGHRGDDQRADRRRSTQLISRAAQRDHAPREFQKLEASWRGLHYLVHQTETSTMLKIKVLNVSKKDLLKDLEQAVEFDQSALFKKVYEEEYGTFGGAPFGALVGDYEFGRQPQDIALLEKISQRGRGGARAVHRGGQPAAVQLGRASPSSTSRATWPRSSRRAEYAKWKSFRESEDSRYVGLCLPHILMRLPYGQDDGAGRGVQLRGGRRRHRPRQVPVGQRRLRLRRPG